MIRRKDPPLAPILPALVFPLLFLAAARAEHFVAEAPVEVHVLPREQGGRVLLSQGGLPLAVLELRDSKAGDGGARPVFSAAQARELLTAAGGVGPLKLGGEEVRELHFALPQDTAGNKLAVLLRVRKTAGGARILVSSELSAALPRAGGGAAPGVECAVRIFPDSAGKLPDSVAIDGGREALSTGTEAGATKEAGPTTAAGTGSLLAAPRRARTISFDRGKGRPRLELARSGPALWQARLEAGQLLLSSRLLADPRQPRALGAFVLYLGCGADGAPPEISPIQLDKPQTAARDPIEGCVRVYASGANPFVLSELAVIAEVALPPGPGGEVALKRLPCFFWEHPGGLAEGEFRFRFAPPAEGVYGVRMVIVSPVGQARGEAVAFRAGPPASPGFARVRAGERHLRFDDGSVLYPVSSVLPVRGTGFQPVKDGQDASATDAPGGAAGLATALRQSFSAMTRGGISLVHEGGAGSAPRVEHVRIGEFDARAAAELDEIFSAAQARELGLICCLESGAAIAAKASASHCYFRERGGPLTATAEFFRDPSARRHFQDRIAYMAARYGAFRSLLAWDVLSGIDESWPILKSGPDDAVLKPTESDLCRRARRDAQEWVDGMALHMKSMDQHGHPVCCSTALPPDKPWLELEALENLDLVLNHPVLPQLQARDSFAPAKHADEAGVFAAWSLAQRQPGRPRRPLLPGILRDQPGEEVAGALSPDKSNAPNPASLLAHNTAFASLAAGFAATPARPASPPAADSAAIGHFAAALAELARRQGKEELRAIAEIVEIPARAPASPPVALRVLGRVGQHGLVAWVQDKASTVAQALARAEPPPAAGPVDLKLPELPKGEYAVVWLNAWTGEPLQAQHTMRVETKAGQKSASMVALAPSFQRDAVLIVLRK